MWNVLFVVIGAVLVRWKGARYSGDEQFAAYHVDAVGEGALKAEVV